MIRALPLLLALAAQPASAQGTGFSFGGHPGLRDAPRALEIFADIAGYADLDPERYGTPAQPAPTELGAHLVQRIFRNVCLGLERGAAQADILPDGFAAYPLVPYMLGDIAPPMDGPGARILSATGSIDADEGNGHPTIWLSPDAQGMTCRAEWHPVPGIAEDRFGSVADMFDSWAAWQFALVGVSRPLMGPAPRQANATEWDRPCADRWCPVTIIYTLPQGPITMETTLNITDIEGSRP